MTLPQSEPLLVCYILTAAGRRKGRVPLLLQLLNKRFRRGLGRRQCVELPIVHPLAWEAMTTWTDISGRLVSLVAHSGIAPWPWYQLSFVSYQEGVQDRNGRQMKSLEDRHVRGLENIYGVAATVRGDSSHIPSTKASHNLVRVGSFISKGVHAKQPITEPFTRHVGPQLVFS